MHADAADMEEEEEEEYRTIQQRAFEKSESKHENKNIKTPASIVYFLTQRTVKLSSACVFITPPLFRHCIVDQNWRKPFVF